MSAPTLKTIAQATGFSVTTVSRALGGYDDVNDETRQVIMSEAIRQGYTPNLSARLLQAQRTQTIGLIVPVGESSSADPFFSEFVAGVSNQTATDGYDLLLNTQIETNELDTYRRIVSRGRVDGLILARTRSRDPRIAYLLDMNMPFVLYGRSDFDNLIYVDLNGYEAQHFLTDHFIRLGHSKIAYIAPPSDLMFAKYRIHGYEETMLEHGLSANDYLRIGCALTEHEGRRIAEELLALPEPPTAIMTGNDLMAFGVMRVIQEHGLSVGRDIAVAGFDDVSLAEYFHPGLTTVRQPIYKIGQCLAKMLIQIIQGEALKQQQVLLKPSLIIRESSGSGE